MWWLCNLCDGVRRLFPAPQVPTYMLLGRKYPYGVDYGNYMHRLAEDMDAAPSLVELFQSPHPWKAYRLPETDLAVDAEAAGNGLWTVTLRNGATPAFFATLEADCAGRWSDGPMHLLPGESRTLTFRPTEGTAEPTFLARDLYSATMRT